MNLHNCFNFNDFRKLAEKRLPSPIFNYIDGAADDEITYKRNTESFNDVDLVPNVLRGVENVDLSTTIFGKKIRLPFYCSPTAVQRLFHHEGERAVAKAADRFGTMFGVSSLATVSVEEVERITNSPKMFQFYFHKDKALNDSMIDRAKEAKFDVLALTVDTITGGNRERDLRTGFKIPPQLTLKGMLSFAAKPMWGINYLTKPKFELPHLQEYVAEGTSAVSSIGDYFSNMLDQSMTWKDAESLCKRWNGHFALKGIMSVEDAKKAIDIGCTGLVLSNHGGRQLDGARSPFDQLQEIVDAVGDKVDIICEGGIQRGTHILKALSMGAKACAGGRLYLYALAAAGQKGVERSLELMRLELERDMKLMGCTSISQLKRSNLRFR